jgi:diguanylate cyclase (GGDEF)-like protein
MVKHKSPINRSIIIGCAALIVALSLLLSLQTRMSFSDALYEQYDARLKNVLMSVEHETDVDDLRECIESGVSSPKRDELQQRLNRMVDDYDLAYLYICIMVKDGQNVMINVVSATSEAERAAGEEDLPLLMDASDWYAPEELARYASAWYQPEKVSYFEETSDYGPCYTACKPLVDSNGEVVAMACADYMVETIHSNVRRNVMRNVALILTVCVTFGMLLALWLRKNVTKPIHALEQSALRFARMTHEVTDAEDLSFDAAEIEASGEVKLLIDAMVKLSQEMKSQVEDSLSAEERASRAEEENAKLTEKAEAAIKIAELTQSVTSLLTNMPGLTFSKDVKTRKYLACNQAFAEFAHRKTPEEVVGLTDLEIFDEATADHFTTDDSKAIGMDEPYVIYEDVLDASGSPRQFQTTKLKFTDATGRLCLLGMSIDFTELMRTKQETIRAMEAYEKAQSASAMYSHIAQALSANYAQLYYVDLATDEFIEYSSTAEDGEMSMERRGEDFFNASHHDAMEQLHPDDRDMFLEMFTKENILRTLAEQGTFALTYRLLSAGGESGYVSLKAVRAQGDEEHLTITVTNVEALDVRNEMTGLYPETAFFIHGKELLREHTDGWCVLAMDLEHFKLFNEWYGREAGDQLLAQIGERLVKKEEDTGALGCYMGQDDFCLLMPYEEEGVKKLYADIHEMIMEHGTSVGFMPAIGVCMTDGDNTLEELYDRAALASKHAKENYHTRIRIFEPSMYQKTERDYQILSDFQQALQNQELFIVLQPQCRIDTGRIVGAESLVRWKKADGKFVSPGIFVPVLEQYGFVTDLDKFVWEEVCIWQRAWIDSGHTPLPVSVNVSQIDIFTIDVPSYFDLLIWKYKLPVDVIKIEITESAYVGDGSVADTVRRLREKGFLVLMDDFGSGYSSLNMLRNLNVDIIKLDAQFLRMNDGDHKGVHILESIVNMAKTMGVPIIVEGVETKEETEFIKSLGCRYVQGYFFYKPMAVSEFEQLIGDPERIDTGGFVFKVKEEFHTREFLDQNIYSDTMLNNILGPVAFFNLHGEDIDCIRYNEQFVSEINSKYFDQLLTSAQRLVLDDDLPVLYGLLEQAMNDPLGGAADIIRFRREDGTVAQFRMQFFFLEEDENGKRFYGSMRDVTQLDKLNGQMRMISRLSNDEVVFVRRRENGILFQVTVHGLEDALGVSRDEFEEELNSGAYRERLEPDKRDGIERMIRDANLQMPDFSAPFPVKGAGGKTVSMQVRFDSIQDKSSGVDYLLILRRAEG